MKKSILLFLATLTVFAYSVPVHAHERQLFNIGGKQYLFVVGSLNEPVSVDDKTGLDLRIKEADPKTPMESGAPGAKPVTGLEQSLKLELQAGPEKKELPITPAYNDPGAYRAIFIPTVETSLTYRVFGTVAGTEFDVSFPCKAGEGSHATEAMEPQKLSEGVTLVSKAGSFGCPKAKETLGFPEPAPSLHKLKGEAEAGANTTSPLSVLALVLASLALIRNKK